ncbi:MAG TPA: sigma-54 dependent transcriptional regulator [Polyangiaceae bacterium]|nr:sigma-54 dependent transcriptional regulator [Polyangiaceae bacterium]
MSELVLIVDDDDAFRRAWVRLLRAEGYEPLEAANAEAARKAFARPGLRLVLLDLMLPPSNRPEAGAELLGEILSRRPGAKVVVVSGTGELAFALSLVRRGAYDFLQKPVEPDVLLALLERARARLELEDKVVDLHERLAAAPGAGGPLGEAPRFVAARELAERAAPADVPVLVTGPSGTGKEVIARYVHEKSRRAGGPFVAVNCGAISPALLESTLFGHKKGSFTGAVGDAKGLFAEASGGTLFLDEIGDLALELQVKLLRALETGEVLPVGASKPAAVDVRVVSATHRPLAEMVQRGQFREDLYWRVRGIEVELPPLAERPGDVLLLAQHFLNRARALAPGRALPRLSAAAQRCLEAHAWPGNLRELRHEMQRALVLAAGRDEIWPEDLSPALRPNDAAPPPAGGPEPATLDEKIAALERAEIARALAACQGNRSHAAERLGLSRQGLLNKMARYGIK